MPDPQATEYMRQAIALLGEARRMGISEEAILFSIAESLKDITPEVAPPEGVMDS